MFISEYGVGGNSGANSGVESSTELVGTRNDAKECRNDAQGSTDAFAITGGVLTLDHENHAHKEESANDLVEEHSEVHLEVIFFFINVVRLGCHWVSGTNPRDIILADIKGSHPGESHGSHASDELSKHNENAEKEIFAIGI